MRRQLFLNGGFTLTSVLVGVAVSAIVVMAGVQIYTRFISHEKHVDMEIARGEIRRAILNRIDCQKTMVGNGRSAKDNSCGSGPLLLYDKSGKPLSKSIDPKRANSGALGDGWYLQARCENSTQSLAVRLLRFTKSGSYARDLRGVPLNANHPKALLFSGNAGKPALCMGAYDLQKIGGGSTVDLYDWTRPTPVVRSMTGANRPNAERREAESQFCIFTGRELIAPGAINTPRCENTVHTYSGVDPCTFTQDATICSWDANDKDTEFAISESYSGTTMTQRCYHVCFPRLP